MEILKIPNPVLLEKSDPVLEFSGLSDFVNDMISIAKQYDLMGLSSPQVGILRQIFIMNIPQLKDDKIEEHWGVFVNPIIKRMKEQGTSFGWEGCGSIPAFEYLVERHNQIVISAQDITGQNFTMKLQGIFARCAQHETHHLEGILISKIGKQRRLKGKN